MAHTSQCGHELECPTNEMHRDLLTQEREVTHALAVLGARVLAKLVETNGSMDLDIPAAVDAVGLADPESDDWAYATPQIAATAAALTQTGGSEGA